MTVTLEETPPDAPHQVSRSWRFPRFAFITAVLALVGLLVFLYPNVAGWFSQYNQSQTIRQVEGLASHDDKTQLQTEIERAREYNASLIAGALVEANTNVPTGSGTEGGDLEYNSLLEATADGVMARLRIPAINVDLPIYHGTSQKTLERGVGHLQGTSLPVGGESQHSVLTAHRGLASAELFTHLDQVEVGDTFTIEVFGEVLTYRVFDTRVVEPDQTESLFPKQGADLVTLVTCTPLGINSHRILVTGERVTPTPITDVNRAGSSPDIPGFPWWAVGIGGAVALLGLYVWGMGRPRAARSAANRGWGISQQDPAPPTEAAGDQGSEAS